MRIKYIDKKFQGATLDLIELANRIISEYQAAGFQLTLRQLYYQLVARGHMANKQREYKRLGSIIADARLAGMVSWEAIEDRTRNVRGNQHWDSPEQIVRAAINSYCIDRWASQPYRPEVWIEKDALVGVIAGVCQQMDVDYFSCRGYVSASEMWQAGHVRFRRYLRNKQTPVIIHLGDHDPSGIDMTRDIQERLQLFADATVLVERIALNWEQVEEYQPPPNPAKLTDSRADGYIALFGMSSWELDALEPQVLAGLIGGTVARLRDDDLWERAVREERNGKERLRQMIR